MKPGFLASLFLVLTLLLPLVARADSPLRVMINDVAPYTLHDSPQHPGMHAEIANLLAKQSGMPISISWAPYARLAAALRFDLADLVVAVESPELEGIARRIAPFHEFKFVVIGRRDKDINSISQLNGRLLGVARGAFYDERINNNADIQKYELTDPFQGVRMLAAGRLDAVISSDYLLSYALRQTGLNIRNFTTPFTVNEKHYVLYANPKLSEAQLQSLSYHMDALQKSGQIATILKAYALK